MPFEDQKDPNDYQIVYTKSDLVVSWLIGFFIGLITCYIVGR